MPEVQHARVAPARREERGLDGGRDDPVSDRAEGEAFACALHLEAHGAAGGAAHQRQHIRGGPAGHSRAVHAQQGVTLLNGPSSSPRPASPSASPARSRDQASASR